MFIAIYPTLVSIPSAVLVISDTCEQPDAGHSCIRLSNLVTSLNSRRISRTHWEPTQWCPLRLPSASGGLAVGGKVVGLPTGLPAGLPAGLNNRAARIIDQIKRAYFCAVPFKAAPYRLPGNNSCSFCGRWQVAGGSSSAANRLVHILSEC